jgi:hypothetical protein
MSLIGKLHEISFYSLLSTFFCLGSGKTTFSALWDAKLNVTSFSTFFLAFLFWACVLYIPIAIIGAFSTKYGDDGEGLTFNSDNIFVIIFAHIAEEILGLFLTPFWFLIDLFKKRLDDDDKVADYVTYLVELIFFGIGIVIL